MMWGYDSHMSGWGWALMSVGMVLFWAVLLTAVVLAVRYLGDSRRRQSDGELTPAEILARRFARGEISEDEFLARTRLIKH